MAETILSAEDVRAIADLARLELSDDDVTLYQQQLSAILDYFQKLEELDTSHIDPTSSVLPLTNVMRADQAGPLCRSKMWSQTPPTAMANSFASAPCWTATSKRDLREPVMSNSIRVAVIQARPEYYDLGRTVAVACALIAEAAGQGAQLAAFGETFFPGYPAWLDYALDYARWDHGPTKQLYARLAANSMALESPEMLRLREYAKKHEIVLVLGINERVTQGRGNRSLYNSIVTVDADGAIVNHHRKLRPTYTEQLVWAQGDGAGLGAVDTAAGRVGALVCWEHWMPHARQALHISNESIHVAIVARRKGKPPDRQPSLRL